MFLFFSWTRCPTEIVSSQSNTYSCQLLFNDRHLFAVLGSWDIQHDRHFSFVILDIFCPFNPLTTQNIKILKKLKKNAWRYYHFTHMYQKWQSCDVWFLRYQAQQTDFFCHFGQFLAHLPPINPKNWNFEKMKKISGDIIILHTSTKSQDHMLYCSWHMTHDRCNYF